MIQAVGRSMIGVAILVGLLSGCGTNLNPASSTDTGSASVTGTVLVSSSDLSQIGVSSNALSVQSSDSSSVGISGATQLPAGTGEIYLVNTDGTVEFTGKKFNVKDGHFQLSGLNPAALYIAKVIAQGPDSTGQQKAIVLYAVIAFNERGQATVSLTENTKIVTDYIVSKVISNGGGTLSASDLAEMQSIIIDAYRSKLGGGDVQRVSPVVDAASVSDGVSGARANWDIDSNSRNVVDLVDENSDVRFKRSQSLATSKVKNIALSKGTIDDAKFMVREIFGAASGGGAKDGVNNGVPEFFIEQFGNAALNKVDVTIEAFAIALNAAITNPILKNYWTVSTLEDQMLAALTGEHSSVRQLYTYYKNPTGNSGVAPFMTAVFPSSEMLPIDAMTIRQKLTVFQALYVAKTIDLINGSTIPLEIRQNMGPQTGPPFDPYTFLKLIHFIDVQDGQTYITELRVIPVTAYKSTGQRVEAVSAINAEVTVYGTTVGQVARVELVYPKKSGGTGTAVFALGNQGQSLSSAVATVSGTSSPETAGHGIVSQFLNRVISGVRRLNQEVVAKIMRVVVEEVETQQVWRICPWQGMGIDPVFVSDYGTGTAIIRVLDANQHELATKAIRLIQFSPNGVEFISPRGMNMDNVQRDGWDRDFEPQVLPIDNNSSTTKPTVSWKDITYTGELPEGTMIAYAVNLGLSVVKHDWNAPMGQYPAISQWDTEGNGYKFKNLWSTWQDGRVLVATSVHIPVELGRSLSSVGGNYDGNYELNVTPLLIDKTSGAIVWQGRDTRTSFKVGVTAPWSLTLHGRVSLNHRISNLIPRDDSGVVSAGQWKIGLFMTGRPSGTHDGWEELFFDGGHKTPVLDVNGNPIVANLGTMDSIAASNYMVDYQLATIAKNHNVLIRNCAYRLIAWYDYTTTPQSVVWIDNKLDAQNGKIDLSGPASEFFDMGPRDIWVDERGVRLRDHGQWSMITDSPDLQQVDVSVGAWSSE